MVSRSLGPLSVCWCWITSEGFCSGSMARTSAAPRSRSARAVASAGPERHTRSVNWASVDCAAAWGVRRALNMASGRRPQKLRFVVFENGEMGDMRGSTGSMVIDQEAEHGLRAVMNQIGSAEAEDDRSGEPNQRHGKRVTGEIGRARRGNVGEERAHAPLELAAGSTCANRKPDERCLLVIVSDNEQRGGDRIRRTRNVCRVAVALRFRVCLPEAYELHRLRRNGQRGAQLEYEECEGITPPPVRFFIM